MTAKTRLVRRQMPAWLEHFDDSRGIVWRSYNTIMRINPKRTGRFVKAWLKGANFHQPVFIIGAPRSGTTLLYETLSLHPDLASLGHEGHDMWRRFHHPRKTHWDDDFIDMSRVNATGERRYVEAFIRARTTQKLDARRFVEKTVDNTLRTQYILKLFPDAKFIAIHRDPCAVVNSIIDGWRDPDGRFRAYFVPEKLSIPEYKYDRRWCFTLIPGWRDLVNAPIPQIAFRQWAEYAKALDDARSIIPKSQLTEIFLDDLRSSPTEVLQKAASNLDLELSETVIQNMCERTTIRVNSFSGQKEFGWRKRNYQEIMALLQDISPLAPFVRFEIDPSTGETSRIYR